MDWVLDPIMNINKFIGIFHTDDEAAHETG